MKFSVKATQIEKQSKTCLIVGIHEAGQFTESAKIIDKATQGHLRNALKQGTFQGKIGQLLPLFHLPGSLFDCVCLVGAGPMDKLTPAQFRQMVTLTFKTLSATSIQKASCYFTELKVEGKSLAWKVKHCVEAASEGVYCFDLFKTQRSSDLSLRDIILHVADPKQVKMAETALKQGLAIAQGVILTKNMANLPSNVCTPTFLAAQAKALAKDYTAISTNILGEKEMQKLGMGAILGVSQGSAEEAKLICMTYKGTKTPKAPIALIGKGVTFDSGGNSLKSPDSMIGMKYDMCGAATVLGIMQAAAELKLPLHLVGILATAENMPGGDAYKPEDIITSLSGQTIEVMNTDAEGRLVLCDALTYCERYKPETVIDIATLTGAVVIALGFHATGLLSNHEPLSQSLIQAGKKSTDRVWPLPLWEEYQEQLKSNFADMTNVGGRSAGTITAACFLSRFAKKFHWAHLDVAGTAAIMGQGPERKATGRPVSLLMQYLIDRN